MPAMYPEELRSLREQNPGLQYDFRGNLIDDGGYGTGLEQQMFDQMYGPVGDQIRNAYYGSGNLLGGLMSGGDGFNYRNDQFVGPVLPGQQQGYTYSDYDQAGPLQPGVSNLSLPNVGFYSQWNPDTNSWVRHGSTSDGLGMGTARPSYSPRVRSQAPASGGQMIPPEIRYQQGGGVDPAYQADLLRQTQQRPFMQSARRAVGDVAFLSNPANETFPNLAYQQE